MQRSYHAIAVVGFVGTNFTVHDLCDEQVDFCQRAYTRGLRTSETTQRSKTKQQKPWHSTRVFTVLAHRDKAG